MTKRPKATSVLLGLATAMACPAQAGEGDGGLGSKAGKVMVEATLSRPEAVLPARQSCLSDGSTTVGKYLADTLTRLTDNSSAETQLTMECNAVKNSPELAQYYALGFFPPQAEKSLRSLDADVELFQCTLGFQYQQGEHAWSRSLQALVDLASETIVQGTGRCLTIP